MRCKENPTCSAFIQQNCCKDKQKKRFFLKITYKQGFIYPSGLTAGSISKAIPLQLMVAVWYKHLLKKKKINQKTKPFRLEGAAGAQPPAQKARLVLHSDQVAFTSWV